MTIVRTYGQFLGNLNHSGRMGKIIKTMPDFEPGTDIEIFKLNHAICTAKKIGTCIITRLDKNDNYNIGIGDTTLLSTFLNNEYIGILSNIGNIHEYQNLGSREYTYGKDIDMLSCFVDNVENYDTDKKNYNDAIKAAHKYQIVIRNDSKYKNEYKGTDDGMITYALNSDYLGIFTKSGNIAEFRKIGIRKISEKTPTPILYNNDVVSDESLTIHTVIIPPPIPIIPPTKKETVESRLYTKFNECVRRTSDFNLIKYKDGEFIDVFGYIDSVNLLSSLLDGNYVGFRSKNKLVEYYNLGTKDLIDDIVQNPILINMGFTEETISFLKSINDAVEKQGWFIYRWKNGSFTSNYYENGTKAQTILNGVDYFAHISDCGRITEFVKIGEREIEMDGIPLPNLNINKEITQLEIDFKEIIKRNLSIIKYKNDILTGDTNVMWNYRIKGSKYFAFRVGNTLVEYSLLEVRSITSSIFPNSKLRNYKMEFEYVFAFQDVLKNASHKFLTRTKSTTYIGGCHMNISDFGKADYIGIIDNDREKIYEYIKTGVREITPDMELPKFI